MDAYRLLKIVEIFSSHAHEGMLTSAAIMRMRGAMARQNRLKMQKPGFECARFCCQVTCEANSGYG
jgi:hypothetical protein